MKLRTFVFGAGASKHAGYPLASSMGQELADWLVGKRSPTPDDISLAAFLKSSASQSNFEDALEEIQTLIDTEYQSLSPGDQGHREVCIKQLAHMKLSLKAWFLELGGKDAFAYEYFARHLVSRGDAIISFNYDIALEMQMRSLAGWELGDGYGFPIDGFIPSTPLQMLKLHGSINWSAIPFEGMAGGFRQIDSGNSLGRRPVITPADATLLNYTDGLYQQFPSAGSPNLIPLIFPARSKQFFFKTSFGLEWEDFWNDLWAKAATGLRQSKEIYICGYSLPMADQSARKLMFSSIRKQSRIEVSCGGDSSRIVDEFRAAGFQNSIVATQSHFEDWVRVQKKS